jgi:hypothetical protein
MRNWQDNGEYPRGQLSEFSPRLSTYNVVLTFTPEENTLRIEFFYLGKQVSIQQLPGGEWEDMADVPMSAVPTRLARETMLKWKHSEECPEAAWARLLNLYFDNLERIVNSFELKREEVTDLENIDE